MGNVTAMKVRAETRQTTDNLIGEESIFFMNN